MNATSRFEPQMKRAFWFTCLVVVAALLVLGGSIEVAQGFTATRSQEWGDLWADCLGVCLGYAAIAFLNRVGTAQKSTQ